MDPTWYLAPIAAAMAAIIAALVRWATHARTVVSAAVVVFLLAMMTAMFVATTIYYSWPGPLSLVLGLWSAAGLMALSVFPLVLLLLREASSHARVGGAYVPRPLKSLAPLAAAVGLLVLASELLMGRSFALADGGPAGSGWPGGFGATISSPWFLLPMAAEMGMTTGWVASRIPRRLVATFAVQSVMMAASPPAFLGALWVDGSTAASGAAMTALLVGLVAAAYRGTTFPPAERRYLVRFFLATAVLGAGVIDWSLSGSPLVFAIGTVGLMLVFFTAVVSPEAFRHRPSDQPADEARVVPAVPRGT